MQPVESLLPQIRTVKSFFSRPQVQLEQVPVGPGVPLGIEVIANRSVGIAGAYGTWGESYSNDELPDVVSRQLGHTLAPEATLNLAELGFTNRHHVFGLSPQELVEVELEVGARLLRAAAAANHWSPDEVDAVLLGISAPPVVDFTAQIARRAGLREDALKVSLHKACDGSMGALHLALNPELPLNSKMPSNLALALLGKRVLVGGIEGLSRFLQQSHDENAYQLFGNAAGVMGVIPGENMQFLVGQDYEVFDEEGVLQVQMSYPHSGQRPSEGTMIEVHQVGENHFCAAGLMHEPQEDVSVVMAGPMGMVKLFVRTGVQVVRDVYTAYREWVQRAGMPDKSPVVAIVHHANYKINKLKEKHLNKEGISLPMPWLLSEFGNVSAASNIIAFLRQLPQLRPGDHVLFDGFGAGTYYDVLVVELGGQV